MPSPFPGMDPYLEDPTVFPDLHDSFATYLREALQAVLPPPYYAAIGQRIWVEVSQRSIGPDDMIARTAAGAGSGPSGGGVAVAPRARAAPVIVRVPHDERREPFVDIYAGRGQDRRLVTTIEVLSP